MYYGPSEQDIEENMIVTDREILRLPFIDLTSPITEYEQFKMVFLFPLALIRIILCFNLTLFIIGLIHFEKYTHINCQKTIHKIIRMIVLLSGCWITTKGIENLKKSPKYAVCIYNHISFLDYFIMATNELISGITTHTFYKIPIINTIFSYFETIFFSYKKGTTDLIVERLKNPQKYRLSIAPEGTVSNGFSLLKFHSGAFVAKVPVLPIIIEYPYKNFNPAWTIEDPLFTIYRYLTQFINFATIEYLPTIYPIQEETPKEYAERVRNIMATSLNVSMVDFTLDDRLETIKKYKMSTMRDKLLKIA